MGSLQWDYADVAEALLDRGADIDPDRPQTLLFCAAARGHIGVVQVLLSGGADIDARQSGGEPALAAALANNQPEVAEALVAHGGDVNTEDRDGRTLLMLASQHASLGLLQRLIAKGVDVNARDHLGRTTLMLAAQYVLLPQNGARLYTHSDTEDHNRIEGDDDDDADSTYEQNDEATELMVYRKDGPRGATSHRRENPSAERGLRSI